MLMGVETTVPSLVDSHLGIPKTTAEEKMFYRVKHTRDFEQSLDTIERAHWCSYIFNTRQLHLHYTNTYLALDRSAFLIGTRQGQKLGGRRKFLPRKDQGLLEVGKGNPKGWIVRLEALDAPHGCGRRLFGSSLLLLDVVLGLFYT